MKIAIVILSIIIVILLLYIILRFTPVCNGGELIADGCGKILFPWVKKFKLPSGKYCCMKCYIKDLQTFTDLRKQAENKGIDLGDV